MAKTKKLTARIAIAFDNAGRHVVFVRHFGGPRPTIKSLVRAVKIEDENGVLPHVCIVEVELTPPKAKVVKVKQVKP